MLIKLNVKYQYKRLSSINVLFSRDCNSRTSSLKSVHMSNVFHSTSSSDELPSISEVKTKFMDVMGLSAGFQTLTQSRSHLMKYLPLSQEELPPRSIKDSFQNAIIPLSSDIKLRDKYVSVLGNVRSGRLMEDMDIFAAWVSMNYIKNPHQPADVPSPYVIVTILVDQITFFDFVPKAHADIRVTGHVSSVGKSSIETIVWLEQEHFGQWQRLTSAIFLMAARSTDLSTSAPVNKLVPADSKEKLIMDEAEVRKKKRREEVIGSVMNQIPQPEEQSIVHNIFLRSVDFHNPTMNRIVLPPGSVWMADTKHSNIIFSHPEDRNLHNKVFGGFLMRQALELAWIVAYFHSKHRPRLLHISDISFKKSVDVGSFLRMSGQVIYTEDKYMQIIVYAEISSPFTGHEGTTNVFNYTYESVEHVKPVIPASYHEAMMFIDGRRHFQEVMGIKTT